MRRLAAVAITSGALVAGLAATAAPALAEPAPVTATSAVAGAKPEPRAATKAAVNFTLKKSGLGATTGYGKYYWSSYGKYRTRAIDARIRDNKKGKYSCIHVVFYGRKGQNLSTEHRVLYNPHGKGTTARVGVASYRLGSFAMRECEGGPTKRGFVETAKGKWRWFK